MVISGDPGGDLFVVVVGEQRQGQRQVRDHVRGQLAVRPPFAYPARGDRVVHRIQRYRVDQHPLVAGMFLIFINGNNSLRCPMRSLISHSAYWSVSTVIPIIRDTGSKSSVP